MKYATLWWSIIASGPGDLTRSLKEASSWARLTYYREVVSQSKNLFAPLYFDFKDDGYTFMAYKGILGHCHARASCNQRSSRFVDSQAMLCTHEILISYALHRISRFQCPQRQCSATWDPTLRRFCERVQKQVWKDSDGVSVQFHEDGSSMADEHDSMLPLPP